VDLREHQVCTGDFKNTHTNQSTISFPEVPKEKSKDVENKEEAVEDHYSINLENKSFCSGLLDADGITHSLTHLGTTYEEFYKLQSFDSCLASSGMNMSSAEIQKSNIIILTCRTDVFYTQQDTRSKRGRKQK